MFLDERATVLQYLCNTLENECFEESMYNTFSGLACELLALQRNPSMNSLASMMLRIARLSCVDVAVLE